MPNRAMPHRNVNPQALEEDAPWKGDSISESAQEVINSTSESVSGKWTPPACT